ncbi:phthiocerol/phthiodiolone dimycocerosyl transferase family protein [uncultured Oscillibacter sp.]|uniref:phthiocerol/phthiodiolone dimycocerosyl transferase family protein n=1 Tax=uncultured Oscillibacter sp. TaxID=876091 RepID=UPI0025D9942D|nr:hypothetical protein [uncultured Oscillibacter sp.]
MSNKQRNRRPLNWSRLDNAAKIFPPTSHGADSGVFRLSCELTEPVEPELLQKALEKTVVQFPHMRMVLRRGGFWYYLEQSTLEPRVVPEHAPPCAPLYHGSHALLFEVSWWRGKVNLDVFHVLSDGSGAIAFFQALLAAYLALRHPEEAAAPAPGASVYARTEDGFAKYYQPHGGRYGGQRRAYHLRGARQGDGGLNILEGVADVEQVLAAAHRCGATLTAYLCAALIRAIREEMRSRDLSRPVVLTVPVDLRSYFPSDTARNFFGTIRVTYDFRERSGDFADIVAAVSETFRSQLTAERLAERMNALSALEHNPLLRPIPLVLKNPILRLSGDVAAWGETATLSNIGRFRLPEAAAPYVKGFSAFMATHCTQLCTCTFGKSFHMGFTSVLLSPEVQRRFFRLLTEDGIDLEIRSNGFYAEETEEA